MLGLKERYGIKELSKWYFEVWNEPDIDYWTGTQAEYFKLYDLSAKAVKELDVRLRIGGPATSKTVWIDEFIAHVKKDSPDFGLNGVSRCDFISTHAYPSDLAFSDSASGNVELHNSGIMKKLFGAARIKIDEAFGVDFPLICGEWNSSAGPYKSCHDECNNAPFIAKIMDDLSGICQGSLFWNISDIYEEVGFHYQPFHGGYGIINVNDIPKSSFNAFKYLKSLGDQRLAVTFSQETVGLGCIATSKGNKTIIVVYYYREPNMKQAESEIIKFRGLPESASEACVSTILPGKGSAYETCLEIGKPEFANRKIIGILEKASRPETGKTDLSADTLKIKLGTLMKIEF
jgi:xylan 1,4-beta-xylosidase